jgi:helix-turn-helix protein
MKKYFILFICLLGIVSISNGQTVEPTKEQIAAQRLETLEQIGVAAKEVGLEDKKTVKLKEVFENLYKNIDSIKANATLTDIEKKEKLKAANGEKDWKIKNLLGDKLKAFNDVRKRLIAEALAKKKQ